jgi:general secretion pathway protein L
LSATDALLVFLNARNEFEGWLQLRGDGIAARGLSIDRIPSPVDPETQEPLRLVAVVPGEAVSVHWLELPSGLAPAQAVAAARLMATDMSAQAVSDMHVAVGSEVSEDSARAVALVPAITMAAWLGRLQEAGIDPDLVVPEPLLLPEPSEGFIRYDRGEIPLFRSRNDAFSVEPELAELIIRDAPVMRVDTDAFEAGLAEQVAAPVVNLRQGAFAKRRRWRIEWPLVRRLAVLGLAIVLVTLAIQVASILRYTYAADALEQQAAAVSGRALRRTGPLANAPALLEQRLTELRGSGAGYSSLASALFEAVRGTPNAELMTMIFAPDGTLRATIQADTPATLAALQQRIGARGFTAEAGPLRTGGGRPTVELTVRGR